VAELTPLVSTAIEAHELLCNCRFWFLFTNNQIRHAQVEIFSKETRLLGLMDFQACTYVPRLQVFTHLPSPNLSIGISVYATASDSLFFLNDVGAAKVYPIPVGGCFKSLLLAGTDQPAVRQESTWCDLPIITYGDLVSVNLPPPKKLSTDQIALPDGSTVKPGELFAGLASPEDASRAKQSEIIKSIVMSAMISGNGEDLQEWSSKTLRPNQWLRVVPMMLVRPKSDKLPYHRSLNAIIRRCT
jgi:hypothetical protein